ncbi:MAG TPA: hypothetical protein V6D08_00440 [Candidatus Obscuribacterales bacterium]
MVSHKPKKQDIEPFAAEGLVSRALRGEISVPADQHHEELPSYYECVRVDADGRLVIEVRTYNGKNKTIAGDECLPGSTKYAEVIARHGKLVPGQVSMFYRYRDGRTELK